MKILMLTPYLPGQLSSGGAVRSYNLIKSLSQKHDISVFCYIRSDKEKEFISELKKYCKKVIVFKRRKAWSPVNILLSGFTPFPFLVSIYLSRSFRKEIVNELSREKYDLIHAETFYVMTNIPATTIPTILVEQTIEYQVYQHFVDNLKFFFVKPLLYLDVLKLKFWERYYWRKAGKVVAVSEADRKTMLSLEKSLDVALVPNGVDLNLFRPAVKSPQTNIIMFLGNFKWLQNTDAAELLIKKIFPIVVKKVRDAKLLIVGQHVPEKIREFNSSNILVQELDVNDDVSIRRSFQNSSCFVSPMRGPGGTRLKNLAAMASKVPLVTTTIGAEGIGVTDEVNGLVRDRVEDIAFAVVRLLKNRNYAKKLAQKAYLLASRNYSWAKMSEKLDQVYEEAVK